MYLYICIPTICAFQFVYIAECLGQIFHMNPVEMLIIISIFVQ